MNTNICTHTNIHMSMSTNTLTEIQHTLTDTHMNILTDIHMNTLTNMITPVHRMSMTMITLMSTDGMIMIIPGTKQKNIHTIIKQELSNLIVIHRMCSHLSQRGRETINGS